MIKIRNKQFEEKKYIFQAGDIVIYGEHNLLRIIVKNYVTQRLLSYNLDGVVKVRGQKGFEMFGYKKVGTLTDFIKFY